MAGHAGDREQTRKRVYNKGSVFLSFSIRFQTLLQMLGRCLDSSLSRSSLLNCFPLTGRLPLPGSKNSPDADSYAFQYASFQYGKKLQCLDGMGTLLLLSHQSLFLGSR